jgi:hypothetical protein
MLTPTPGRGSLVAQIRLSKQNIVPHETAASQGQHPPKGAPDPTPARKDGRPIYQLIRRRSAKDRAIDRYLGSDHKLGSKSMAEDGKQEGVSSQPEGRRTTSPCSTCLDPSIVSANHLGTTICSASGLPRQGKHPQNHSPASITRGNQ